MEPIPETRTALEELGLTADDDLLASLLDTAERVRAVVPTCVGLSLAMLEHDITFTLVATSDEVRRADAAQYLEDGPCVEGGRAGDVVAYDADDPLDEQRWAAFARTAAAVGIRSSLTLPMLGPEGESIGSVNLYAAEPGAFDGHHEELAELLDAWAPGAVADADLSFRTRETARAAPSTLEDRSLVDQAIGVLTARRGIDVEEAAAVIRDVAERAGTSQVEVALTVLDAMGPRRGTGDL